MNLNSFLLENLCLKNICHNPIPSQPSNCTMRGENDFHCQCPLGFGGKQCEYRKCQNTYFVKLLFSSIKAIC